MNENKTLLIHPGGLGDVCLSESTFLSLSRHYEEGITVLGNRRFLQLFKEYFTGIESIETRQWLYLFSEIEPQTIWRRIIFIGKDRDGRLRKQWQRFSREPLIFIDMYPEIDTAKVHGALGETDILHVEEYQIRQLITYSITPLKKTINPLPSRRVILYPETGFKKEKWDVKNFITLYERLQSQGIMVTILKALDTPIPVKECIYFEDIAHIKSFFQDGGIFVSSDSGVAHLAGACGLFTITLFFQHDPRIWHPRGRNISLLSGKDTITVDNIVRKIKEVLSA